MMIRRFFPKRLDLFAAQKYETPCMFTVRSFSTEEKKKDKKKAHMSDAASAEQELHEALCLYIDKYREAFKMKIEWPEEVQEEHSRIGREYQIQSFKEHARQGREKSDQIWLQRYALDALPEELRKQALVIDETPPPHRENLFMTPPIKGFDATKYEEEANAAEF